MFGTRHKFIKMEGEGEGGQGGAGGGGQGGGQGDPWYNSFKDEEVKSWLGSMNGAYPDPESVAMKAYNMERFLGADKAGRGVVLPKPDAKPEEWQEFYRKIGGVPETADGYKLSTELAADPMVTKFREYAHKTGMPPMFFDAAIKWYETETAEAGKNQFDDFQRQADAELEELRGEWVGDEYNKNIEMGRRAAAQFLPHESEEQLAEMVTRLEGAMGTKGALKFLANIGNALGEHGFEGGEGNGGTGGMTPAAARYRIDTLKRDSSFQARFANRDADAMREWDDLHKVAFSKST